MTGPVLPDGDVGTAPGRVSVLVVDDHALMRSGLRTLIDGTLDLHVVGTANDGREALDRVAELAPQVVLMDLSMPVMDGVEATAAITRAHPDVQVLVLSSFADEVRVLDALDAGASGYVLKDTRPAELLAGIRAVAAGRSPLDPRVARTVLHARRSRPAADILTCREREVLALLAEGLANKQIARRLDIRETTVKAHLTSVFARIGVHDRTSAALWAHRHPVDPPGTGGSRTP